MNDLEVAKQNIKSNYLIMIEKIQKKKKIIKNKN